MSKELNTPIATEEEAEKLAQSLKQEYGTTFIVSVESEGTTNHIILRKPDRVLLRRLAPMLAASQLFEITEKVLANCMVAGDPKLQDDDDFVLGAMMTIEQYLFSARATLKKK